MRKLLLEISMIPYYLSRWCANLLISVMSTKKAPTKIVMLSTPCTKHDPLNHLFEADPNIEHEWRYSSPEEILSDLESAINYIKDESMNKFKDPKHSPEYLKKMKAVTIETWQYLADHPECIFKSEIPIEMYNKIREHVASCPLCSIFIYTSCVGCPLYAAGLGCVGCRVTATLRGPYGEWAESDPEDSTTRQSAAQKIVDIVTAWEIEEYKK